MLPELTLDEYGAALDEIARVLLDEVDWTRPPVDALALARQLGLPVAWDEAQAGRGRMVRLGGAGGGAALASILIRPDPRPERLQWAVAHEIGESRAAEVFDYLGVDPREAAPNAREAVANHLAGRILLPRGWFGADARQCDWDLVELKRLYSTASHELIARRMLDFAPPVVISVFDQGRRTWRQSNLGGRLPPFSQLEQHAWHQAHALGQPTDQHAALCRVQAWPVHEPQWKREILRTEWLGEDQDECWE